jgi:hypothetical protein
MPDGLFVGFGYPVRGREQKAIGVFNEFVGFFSRLQQEGEIDGFEPVFLEAHGGDLGGFFLLRGDGERLSRIRVSGDWLDLSYRAQLTVEGFGVVAAVLGGEIESELGRFERHVGELA